MCIDLIIDFFLVRNGTSGSRLASTEGALPRPTVRLGRSRIISLFKKMSS